MGGKLKENGALSTINDFHFKCVRTAAPFCHLFTLEVSQLPFLVPHFARNFHFFGHRLFLFFPFLGWDNNSLWLHTKFDFIRKTLSG